MLSEMWWDINEEMVKDDRNQGLELACLWLGKGQESDSKGKATGIFWERHSSLRLTPYYIHRNIHIYYMNIQGGNAGGKE